MRDKFNILFDSSYNLLEASKKNEKNIEVAIINLNKNVNTLNDRAKALDKKTEYSVQKASDRYAERISQEVISKLKNANESAERAAKKYEKAAKLSVFKLGLMFFSFFLLAGALLWFFFIKDIPTISEINSLRQEKNALEKDILKMKSYGDLASCGDERELCIKVDISTSYGDKSPHYYVILPK